MRSIKSIFKNKIFLIGAASFMLPTLALYIIFALNGVHPFGDKQILVTDLWHQYYPFLCTLQEKLKAGESLLYAETLGLGVNFWALIAYYCASPLNALVALVSKDSLRDLVVVIVCMKVGFSGLFFSMYLKKVFNRYEYSTVAFSAVYALCGYVLGYYWNIMWLDCVALLPLVMLGVYLIVKENKWILYVISLAICVITNFYIGFMVCIFTAIYFFMECVKQNVKGKDFIKKLALIAVASILALCMTAFMSIPAYNALGDTVSSVPKTAEKTDTFSEIFINIKDGVVELFKDAPNVIGRTASFNQPVPKEGLPNVFSGFISILLFGFFLCAKNIKRREKLAVGAVVLILIASMSINDLDIIWHGMHKPNMVPYRYAFVFSFIMISTAYRTFLAVFDNENGIKKSNVNISMLVSFLVGATVIVCAFKKAEIATILGCASLMIVYLVVIMNCCQEKRESVKEKWVKSLCGLIVAEVVINTIIAVPVVRTTTYSSYYYRGNEIEKLLEAADVDSSYGRVETSQEYILNDPALYGYKGVSLFSSTANYPVTKLMEKLAICAPPRANRYYYQTTSPLTNAFLGVEHIIFKNGMKNLNPYLEDVAMEPTPDKKYENTIYYNTASLPLGFMVEETLLDNELTGENAFDIQNDLFRKSTGLDGDLFARVSLSSVPSYNTIKVKGSKEGVYTLELEKDATEKVIALNYLLENDSCLFAYIDAASVSSVKVDGTKYKAAKRKYIFPAGEYEAGEKVKFEFTMEDSFKDTARITFHVYSMNKELFETGLAILNDEQFVIDTYKSTLIEGTINAKSDGAFYTSIPYEKGWKMFVDGKKVEIVPFEGAFIAAKLDEGEHSVKLTYSPYGYKMGVVISLLAVIVFIYAAVFVKRRKRNG